MYQKIFRKNLAHKYLTWFKYFYEFSTQNVLIPSHVSVVFVNNRYIRNNNLLQKNIHEDLL